MTERQAMMPSGRHTWFADLLGGRSHLGPNAMAHAEASLAASSDAPGFERIDAIRQAVAVVDADVIGATRSEANELRVEIETGQFPMIARVVRDATHPSSDVLFEQGLACVIEGIAARVRG